MTCVLCGSDNTVVQFEIATNRLLKEWKATFYLDIQHELWNVDI
jgi:hypothetical protein